MVENKLGLWSRYRQWRAMRGLNTSERMAELDAALRRKKYVNTTAAVGMVTLAWATVELPLDIMNWAIVQSLPKRRPFPLPLSRKISLFREGHEKLSLLYSIQDNAAKLADMVEYLSEKRHDITHGTAMTNLAEDVFDFYRLHVPKGGDSHLLFGEIKPYSFEEIFDLSKDIADLSKGLMLHQKMLLSALRPTEDISNLFGQIPARKR